MKGADLVEVSDLLRRMLKPQAGGVMLIRGWQKWDLIPGDVDLLITHMPPHNLHDLAYDPRSGSGSSSSRQRAEVCDVCGASHPSYSHWGSKSLAERVQQLRPLAHIYGHVHDSQG
jgi:Icc-related predicted phosphoesterase